MCKVIVVTIPPNAITIPTAFITKPTGWVLKLFLLIFSNYPAGDSNQRSAGFTG